MSFTVTLNKPAEVSLDNGVVTVVKGVPTAAKIASLLLESTPRISTSERTQGTSGNLRQFAPVDVRSMILTHGGSGGGGGANGLSAYEIAVVEGFVGDEAAWLLSLVGADGTDGDAGADGQDGADGADGAPGSDGATGSQGPPGTDGADGADGSAGADGQDGAAGAAGPGVPVGGTTGQILSKIDAADYNTEWIDSTTGPQGPQGNTGPSGADGSDGSDGADGLSAYQVAVNEGFTGNEAAWLVSLEGADGSDGATGAQGIQGIQGIQGEVGPQGPQGNPGDDGADGATGAQGPQGDTGQAGSDGNDGANGATGAPGNDGADGADGAAGADGTDGEGWFVDFNLQTGTTYTLIASDTRKIVRCTNASAVTVTVNNSVFAANDVVTILQGGDGSVSLAGTATARVPASFSAETLEQYASITLMFISPTEYYVSGVMAAA